MRLTTSEVLALRLSALLLAGSAERPTTVAGITEWFGAMQAQDLGNGLWSFGVRMPGATEAEVTAALERREVLRTWPMRGTVHFVPPRDARWMVEILGARPLAQAASRRAQIGIEADDAERPVEVLGSALSGGVRLTRAQCIAALADAGIAVAGQHGYHLLCSGSRASAASSASPRTSARSRPSLFSTTGHLTRTDRTVTRPSGSSRCASSAATVPRRAATSRGGPV